MMTARAYSVLSTNRDRKTLESLSDNQLLVAYNRGEELAIKVLFDRYRPKLIGYLYRSIRDWEKAEDTVQEIFLRVHRHRLNFDRTKSFSSWIYHIAMNMRINTVRNMKRDRIVPFSRLKNPLEDDESGPQFEDLGSRPDTMYEKRHLREMVDETVAALPEHHREVFVMREVLGMEYDDIVKVTGCKLGTVKSRLNRSRTAFKTLIMPKLG